VYLCLSAKRTVPQKVAGRFLGAWSNCFPTFAENLEQLEQKNARNQQNSQWPSLAPAAFFNTFATQACPTKHSKISMKTLPNK